MNKLLELVSVVNRNKVKTIEVIGNLPTRKTMVQDFYEKLSSGEIKNDEEAAAFFYQSTPDERNYKELKRRLTDRLYNTSFFIDLNQTKYDGLRKAYYNGWRELAVAKILTGKGAHINYNYLFKKILRNAIKYNFSLLVIEATRQLKAHYSTVEFNHKQFKHYSALHNKYLSLYQAEAKAEEYYGSLQILYYNNKHKNIEEINAIALDYIKELNPLADQFDSFRLQIPYYLIRVNRASAIGEIEETINIASEALTYFSAEATYSVRGLSIFRDWLSQMYWQKRDFKAAEELILSSLKYTEAGGVNWNSKNSLLFLVKLHSKAYQEAYELLISHMNHKGFQNLTPYHQEIWKLYEAYINYLISMNKIKGVAPSKYKINKFLNEVPLFSRDKQMRNVPVLIIQLLFLLLYKRYDEAIDRMEAVSLYCYRYLKKDETYRSNCFIRMLLKIVEADFHQTGSRRRAEELRKKLSNISFDTTHQAYETEIIPYEDLWGLALESLNNKFWKSKHKKITIKTPF
ncbi:MAG: hypothetical protein Sapg2KO_15550 [Saprospiraceae bacterium]